MNKLFLVYLIIQISSLAGAPLMTVSDSSKNEAENTLNYDLQDDKKDDRTWQNKFKAYLTDPDRKTRLAITTGLNVCYIHSSTSHHITYDNHDSFEEVVYGPNFGVSFINKMYDDSKLTRLGKEVEMGIYLSKEISRSSDYVEMKDSKGVYYVQFSSSVRWVKKITSDNFFNFGFGFYIGKGISEEWKHKDWDIFYALSYRRKRLEAEILCKFVLIDWDGAFAGALTPYTDIAFTQSAIFKFNLKYRI